MKKSTVLLATLFTCGTVIATVASAKVANPAPWPIIDRWEYGTYTTRYGNTYDYSNYYVESAGYGSYSAIKSKNWPYSTVASSKQNYGWANSEHKRAWNDGKGQTQIWDYYRF